MKLDNAKSCMQLAAPAAGSVAAVTCKGASRKGFKGIGGYS